MIGGVWPKDPLIRTLLEDVLIVEAHPGWTYVPGSLADQPSVYLKVENALARARAKKAEVTRSDAPE